MEQQLIIHNFFHGLSQRAQDHIDAAVGGAFNQIASNQSWKGDRQPAHVKEVHH
jgi:hypothetical protein